MALAVLATATISPRHAHHRHHRRHHHKIKQTGPVGPRLFGFNDNSVLMEQVAASAELRREARVGADLIRYTVNWDYVEPQKGKFNWHGYDPLYAEGIKNQIRPILVLASSPSWTR